MASVIALRGSAPTPVGKLREFSVCIRLADGRNIRYRALSPNSFAALESAFALHPDEPCRISVHPKLMSVT
nr:hypothetical protein [Dechloromonas sp.]